MDYSAFAPILVEGLKEQGKHLSSLTDRVLELEQRYDGSEIESTALREGHSSAGQQELSQPPASMLPSTASRRSEARSGQSNGRTGGGGSVGGAAEVEYRSRIAQLELQVQELRQLLETAGLVSRD